jgi:hypothetical protein
MTVEALRGEVQALLNNYPGMATKEMEDGEPAWWWLSFSTGPDFAGVVIVFAHGLLEAVRVCHEQGLIPGPLVMGTPMQENQVPAEKYRHKILYHKEIYEFFPTMKTIAVLEDDSIEIL